MILESVLAIRKIVLGSENRLTLLRRRFLPLDFTSSESYLLMTVAELITVSDQFPCTGAVQLINAKADLFYRVEI